MNDNRSDSGVHRSNITVAFWHGAWSLELNWGSFFGVEHKSNGLNYRCAACVHVHVGHRSLPPRMFTNFIFECFLFFTTGFEGLEPFVWI